MRLHQLRYFEAVARVRNFTRAAEAVHVAQPSLSNQIRVLERDLGARLFNRARGNITLTAAGETLLPLARRILADVDEARLQVRELIGLSLGRLRIGATPSLATVLLPPVVRVFADTYPGVTLAIEESGSRDLVRHLADGAIDLALIILPLHPGDPALATAPLLTEPLVVAAPRGTLEGSGALTLAELGQHRLVMFRDGYDIRETTIAAFRRAGVEPTFAVEGGEMDTVIRLVEAGLGVAVVPSMVVIDRPHAHAVPLADPVMTRTVAIAHRRDVEPSNAAREFRRMLEEHLRAASSGDSLPVGVRLAIPEEEGT